MAHLLFDSEPKRHQSFELAGARPHYNPDRPGQVEHIFLDLALDMMAQTCQGSCQIRLNPVRSGLKTLVLDAVDLQIEGVKVGRVKQPFDCDGRQLQIHLKQPTQVGKVIKIAIAYSLTQPQRGLYFIQPDAHYPDKPIQAWTQGEDEDSRFWFPCFDYPGQLATSEMRVRVPQAYLAISNGELIATETVGKDKIYHWWQQQVHPTYLMTLAVGKFVEIQDEWQGKPVCYYVEKGQEDAARLTMGKTPRMIEFFSQQYGLPYPYPKYAQVCVDDFIFGGMENTSTTLLTDRCLLDERAALDNSASESLVAHELAHQWFGDLVVIKHWSHAWLKEGMASYSEVMWTDHEYGPEDAAYYRLQEARNYFDEDSHRYRRPVVTHVYRQAIELYDRHLYEKGACIYHMIRAELGDELFWRAIQTFVRDHAHQTVETTDLLRAIEKATGRNLLFLFDQYLYRGGHPEYQVSYSWDADSQMAKVTITQTQVHPQAKQGDQDLFDLKLPIAFGYQRQKQPLEMQRFRVRVHEQEQSFYFALTEKPTFISFDHGNHYLKQVTLEYPWPELTAQLQFDPDPVSRIHAAVAIAKKGGLEGLKALGTALKTDPFWGVRVEVAAQLAQIKLDQGVKILKPGLADPDPRVRRAVVTALATIKTDESFKAIKPLAEKGDASYYVEAAALQGMGAIAASTLTDKPKAGKVLKILKSALKDRSGWNQVVRCGAIAGLGQMKTSVAALELVLDYTDVGIPQPLRLAAIRALGPLSLGQATPELERILNRLSVLVGEPFFLTQVAVAAALGQMETVKALKLLQALADQTADARVRRMAEEAKQKVQTKVKSDHVLQSIQTELEQLQKSNQELKSRLAELEVQAKSAASKR